MTSDEAYDYWFRRVDFERKTPTPDDLKLEHIAAILARLGNPQHRFRIVHVAGSKGKGSTAAMLDAILRAQGYRVGLFTSPHLVRVEERIQVDGEPIAPLDAAARLEEIADAGRLPIASESGPLNETLTFFEIATALGFLHFATRSVDWAIVEVGLGGRLDSTNVVMPEAAVITSISYDHTQTLGNTLAKIAFEKAGIVKPGRPTISGVVDPDARSVIESRCAALGSPLAQLGREFTYSHEPAVEQDDAYGDRVAVCTWRGTAQSYLVNLRGAHQAANAAVAAATVDCLRERGVQIDDASIARGLATVRWPARLEVVSREPLIVLDCAHNVASAAALREALLASFPKSPRRILVFASSRDKDVAGMFAELAPIFSDVIVTRFANVRAMATDRLLELIPANATCRRSCVENPAEALKLARTLAGPADLICAAGSVFLAGELRPLIV